ncbi:PEP-CTERM sorting domain-containing protein [Candidatus Manganitrophus noduliformans]|uniref:PEP-CTERM sorting domain-containing protein n=1 Tax=Candidatus Manganitrophus noduliformans TaxID=2606439 RepID=A0A7X6DLL4_9BACT|nr:PEP-CTERM sorting domain-containing protein [Candidatus Manganitrophus noduliformans]NKE69435.1 PEP-CTERM sorting domain-containing protein [Candidatus Manganitrophus noduliformans]
MPTLSTAFPLRQRGIRALTIVAAITLMFGAASPAWALSISQAYILSDWTSPTSATAAPFTVNGTAGFQLTLNSSGVATSATALGGPLTIQTTDRLYYQSHTGTIDPNEVSSSQLASRVNSEIAKLDDAGFVNESSDAALNIDFRDSSSVTLRTSTQDVSVTGLVFFEDAGLDPFSLRYCYDTSCTQSDLLFNGFNSSASATILASSSGLETDDYAPEIDQAYWFIFDQAVTGGYFRIAETTNFGGYQSELLEIDFIGLTSTPSAQVPEPSALLLVAAGLMGLPFLRKLQKS